MVGVRNGLGTVCAVLLGLVASSCSCGGDASTHLAPQFVLEGDAVGVDPLGEAHYVLDFGTVTVGSRLTPEVYIYNAGTARLTVKADVDGIPAPFSLGSGAFDLEPKARRALEFTIAPTTEGTFDEVVTFTTNEKENSRRIRLVGKATQSKLVCEPSHLDLGHVVVGESRSRTVTCTNHLDIPTTVSLGDFIGAYRSYFRAEFTSLGDGRTATIPAGGTVEIEIAFTADNIAGVASATLPVLDPSARVVQSLQI